MLRAEGARRLAVQRRNLPSGIPRNPALGVGRIAASLGAVVAGALEATADRFRPAFCQRIEAATYLFRTALPRLGKKCLAIFSTASASATGVTPNPAVNRTLRIRPRKAGYFER